MTALPDTREARVALTLQLFESTRRSFRRGWRRRWRVEIARTYENVTFVTPVAEGWFNSYAAAQYIRFEWPEAAIARSALAQIQRDYS